MTISDSDLDAKSDRIVGFKKISDRIVGADVIYYCYPKRKSAFFS